VTGESAIICPQSLLFDIRADHDANAVLQVFTAISNRSGKAQAIGCEVIREGIAVKAEKMSAPFDYYVSISANGLPGRFFTMESELENPEAASTVSEGSADVSASGGKISAQAMAEQGYQEELAQFQKSFSTLEEPMPNLRWFAEIKPDADSQLTVSTLVTPFGPCIAMLNDPPTGVLLYVQNPFNHKEKGKFLGQYSNQEDASNAAVAYCHRSYISGQNKASTEPGGSHLWFIPDETDGADLTALTPSAPVSPSSPNGSKQTLAKKLAWSTLPNGVEKLSGLNGTCATLSPQHPESDSDLTLWLSNGTTIIFPNHRMGDAVQAAQDYCDQPH